MSQPDLVGRVALVAGATRGAGRAIAFELATAGAFVYATGRSTAHHRSPMQRPETIDQTVELITTAGGRATAVQVDHTRPAEVEALVDRISREHNGRLDIVVNDIWGGDPLTQWGVPFWEHDLANGLAIQHLAVETHLITSWYAAPLLVARGAGLIVEVTDGLDPGYRGSLFYDLAKASVLRIALAQAADLRPHGVTVVAVTPGFLRSEAVLDHFGVSASNWRDAIAQDQHFAASETPHFLARGLVALAADPDLLQHSGQAYGSWDLARLYDIDDLDGTRPDWQTYFREVVQAAPADVTR